MLACWQTYVYFNILSNIVNKKMTKEELFFAALPAADILPILTHKRAADLVDFSILLANDLY